MQKMHQRISVESQENFTNVPDRFNQDTGVDTYGLLLNNFCYAKDTCIL